MIPAPRNAKPFTWEGKTWPSFLAFCRHHGLHVETVRSRLKNGVSGESLIKQAREYRKR